MKKIIVIAFALCIFATSCGNIDDTDGKIGNEPKETAESEDIKDKAEKIMDDASRSARDIMDDVKGAMSADIAEEKRITCEQAQSVAFYDAGKAQRDVTIYKTYLNNENGRTYYDVEFADGQTLYGYEIDPVSGDILRKELNCIK